ncbi:M56 family metallopeptidase [Pollutibacter soli]|uniref:M56 family metallopeptidase n=1 Tax=Pollutibacter soli TaxID=3034157 RepID=UPI00301354C2
MESNLFNSTAVLYALGWAIAHSLWQMGALWLVFQLFFGLHKNQKPAIRYSGALVLFTGGFIWFVVTFLQQFNHYQLFTKYIEQLPLTGADPAVIDLLNTDTTRWTDLSALYSLFDKFVPFLSAGYIIVLFFLAIRFINAYAYTQSLRSTGIVGAGEYFNKKLDSFLDSMQLPSDIQLFFSEVIDVPATIGFIKPVILLPVATITNLSAEQVEAIILHELAHIRRQDYLLNMIVAIMETILFFNPFAHLLTVSLKKERELFCDDFVVSYNKNPQNYASALLSLEKMRKEQKLVLAVAATGHDGVLLNRVKRILNIKTNTFQYKEKIVALFFISLLLSTLAWLDPMPENQKMYARSINNADPVAVSDAAPEPTVVDLIRKDFASTDSSKMVAVKKNIKPVLREGSLVPSSERRATVQNPLPSIFVHSPAAPAEPPASTNLRFYSPDARIASTEAELENNINYTYSFDFKQQKYADSVLGSVYQSQKGKIGSKEYNAYLDKIKELKDAGYAFSPWFLQKMTALYRNELNNTRNLQRTRGVAIRRIPERTAASLHSFFMPETGLAIAEAPAAAFGGSTEALQNVEAPPADPKVAEKFEAMGNLRTTVNGQAFVQLATPGDVMVWGTKKARAKKTEGSKSKSDQYNQDADTYVSGYTYTPAYPKWNDEHGGATFDTSYSHKKVSTTPSSNSTVVVQGYPRKVTTVRKSKPAVVIHPKEQKETIVILIETETRSINIEVEPESN